MEVNENSAPFSGALFLLLVAWLTLAIGETATPDFGDPADDHKAIRVDISGQMFDLWQFVVGDNTQNQLCLLL